MPIELKDIIAFFKHISICEGFNSAELELLAKHFSYSKLSADICIFNEKDKPEAFYIIYSGMIKIVKTEEDGSEIIVSLLNKGDCFGELAIIDKSSRNAGAFTVHDAEILRMDLKIFLDLLKNLPGFAVNILKIYLRWLKEANELSRYLSLCSSEKTILNTLFKLGLKCGTLKDNMLIIPPVLSHQEMASMAGTSRKNFTTTLKNLEDKKIITRSGDSREKMDICINNYQKIVKLFD